MLRPAPPGRVHAAGVAVAIVVNEATAAPVWEPE